jgi:folate-dependent tRNA-U54 methylase TrmFO/GidA
MDVAWFQSRYDKGETGGDGGLHQLPDGQGAVRGLHRRLLAGEKTEFKEWEARPISTAACRSR